MDITRIDSRTSATEFSWQRACVLTGLVWAVWTALELAITLTHPGLPHHETDVWLVCVFGCAGELGRRNHARRAARQR